MNFSVPDGWQKTVDPAVPDWIHFVPSGQTYNRSDGLITLDSVDKEDGETLDGVIDYWIADEYDDEDDFKPPKGDSKYLRTERMPLWTLDNQAARYIDNFPEDGDTPPGAEFVYFWDSYAFLESQTQVHIFCLRTRRSVNTDQHRPSFEAFVQSFSLT